MKTSQTLSARLLFNCQPVKLAALIIAASLLLIGCGQAATTEPELDTASETELPVEMATYDKHGFSFEYPAGFDVEEVGVLDVEATDESGVVQVILEDDEIQVFQVVWMQSQEWSEEGSIAGAISSMESSEDIVSVETGELLETTLDGERLVYQSYSVSAPDGESVAGILASSYCDAGGLGLGFMTMHSALSDEQELLDDLMEYLDTFDC